MSSLMTRMLSTVNIHLTNFAWRMFNYGDSGATPPHLTQTIDMQGRFPLAVEISKLPGSSGLFTLQANCMALSLFAAWIMATASTDHNIRVLTRSGDLVRLICLAV